jgi:hypothetical protein
VATYQINFCQMFNLNSIGVLPSKQVAPYQMFKEVLENTPHTFIFIITIVQWEGWKIKCKEYGWDKFVVFEMPEFVRNPRYRPPDYPEPRLKLVVMKGQGNDES